MKRTPLGIDNYEMAYQYRYYVNKTNVTVTLADLSKGTGLLFTRPRRFRQFLMPSTALLLKQNPSFSSSNQAMLKNYALRAID